MKNLLRVWYWTGEPIENSVPECITFQDISKALEFARAMKRKNRLGYVVWVDVKKDENGDDVYVEVGEYVRRKKNKRTTV